MSSTYTHDLVIARRAVHLGSLLTKQHLLSYQSLKAQVSEETKPDASEVTVADFASQAVIISIVHAVFPDDEFIAEESSAMLRSNVELRARVWELVDKAKRLVESTRGFWTGAADNVEVKLPQSPGEMMDIIDLGQVGGRDGKAKRSWILDPIDGTLTYIRGRQYAVCLCLVEHLEQQVAVLGCPNLNVEERDPEGRVVVREDVVDLELLGGWMLSATLRGGTCLERIRDPGLRRPLESVVGPGEATGNGVSAKGEVKDEDVKLRFTDSSASPHISKDLHNAIFEHFMPPTATRNLSMPAVPEGYPSLAVAIWSMQMKYVILTLRASDADAMIRTPPCIEYHAAVWDHAGGQLLLRESGGALSDANGVEFVVDGKTRKLETNWGVCATRGGRYRQGISAQRAHDIVLTKVKELVGKRRRQKPESVGID